MKTKTLPKDKWEITISGGRLILGAAASVLDDGSEIMQYKAFDLVDNATDYPVGLIDLKGVEFTVEVRDPVGGSGQGGSLHAENILGETLYVADNLKVLVDVDGVAFAIHIKA